MPRDPRTRNFRIAAMTIFVGFAVVYILLVSRGIVVSLLHQGALPTANQPTDCRRSADSCGQGLRDLRVALDEKSTEVQRTGTQAERRWDDWSAGWRRDLAALSAECCLGTKSDSARAPLDRAATDLEELGRLYTTHLVQYAREIGPQAERCASDLAVIGGSDRRQPPAAPLPNTDPGHP